MRCWPAGSPSSASITGSIGQTFREYFGFLGRAKHAQEHPTVEQVARTLYDIPVKSTDKRALQFSFATKLAHMLNPRLPVYDRMIETFYFLPRSYAGKAEKKLDNLCTSYRFLINEYDRILREGLLAQVLDGFRKHFLPLDYTDQKNINTLIWKFFPFLEGRAIRDGTVTHI